MKKRYKENITIIELEEKEIVVREWVFLEVE